MAVQQDESNIKNLSGLSAIRKKPTLHIGSISGTGVWTILREVADNTVDEALAGRNDKCLIRVMPDGSYIVADAGGGIPVKPIKVQDAVSRKIYSISALQAVTSLRDTGGKMDNKAYASSRGTHGLGQKCTVALSTKFQVWTHRDGQWWTVSYKKGEMDTEVSKVDAPPKGLTPFGKGTVVRFAPDPSIFTSLKLPSADLLEWCRITAYLTPNFKIQVINSKGDKKLFHAKEGPKQLILDTVEELKCTALGKHFVSHTDLADVVVAFTDHDGEPLKGYTNGLYNVEGGVHINAVMRAMMAAIKPHMKQKQEFTINELRNGVVGLVNAKLSTPQFDSQTKEKLVDERMGKDFAEIIHKEFKKFFAENKALAGRICERCDSLKSLKNKFAVSKEVLKELKNIRNQGFPKQFAASPKATPEQRELFLVEGDSAGGTAKQARNYLYQEVLPLKGKIINALKHSAERVLASDEVLAILSTVGIQPDQADPYKNLRTHKLIYLTDPDHDGRHIECLLNSLNFTFLPELIARGMVYSVVAPEYVASDKDGNLVGGKTAEEVRKKLPKAEIQHLKGWGEATIEQLEQLAFDPKRRKLVRITAVVGQKAKDFIALMGDDTSARKTLLGVE